MIFRNFALTFSLLLSLFSLAPSARAQPAAPAPAAAPASVPDAAAAAATPRLLKHILIADSVAAAEAIKAAPDSPFVMLAPGLASFDAKEINTRLGAGINQPIEQRLLAAITQVVENFFRIHEYPAAIAVVPSQNIAEGEVRLIVTLGSRGKTLGATEWKIRKINMQGAHWFSESLLREKLRIEQGSMIRYSDLDQAIGWANNNPFRRVQVQFDPVPNQSGEADITVAVQDALPLRFTASYSNSGNESIGRSQYIASVSYGNLWGKDHQISYQHITTDRPKYFQAHGLDYRVPLPWRHYVQFSASYLRARPELAAGLLKQNGENFSANLRYTIPLRAGDNPVEFFSSLDFKESNNNLAYYGTQVLNTKTDIFQVTSGLSTVLRDRRGGWVLGATFTVSPGGINSRNTTEAFDANRFNPLLDSARFGAKATYAYGTLTAQRALNLRPGFDWSARAVVQVSQANLLASEQLGIGGAATVRGFPESIFTGDNGYLFTNDLLLPSWKTKLPRLSKTRGPLETRPLVFFDAGDTSVHQRFAIDPKHVALASAGVGLRMGLAGNFSLTADYGWQLTNLPYPVEPRRGHIRATLAF